MPSIRRFEKWVCLNKKCGAVHLDRFNSCRRCGYWLLGRREIVDVDIELKLDIDELKLDKELKIQATMVRYWSEKTAEAQARYDEAKSKLDIVAAELNLEIRKNPDKYGIDKLTETTINAIVITHPDHRIATKKVNEARYNLDMAKAAINGLEHKKRALTLLTELFVRDYYSTNTIEPKTQEAQNYDKERIRSAARRRRQEEDEHDEDD